MSDKQIAKVPNNLNTSNAYKMLIFRRFNFTPLSQSCFYNGRLLSATQMPYVRPSWIFSLNVGVNAVYKKIMCTIFL